MVNERIDIIENQISEDLTKRYSKVYNIHKYWSRKPWYPISSCIMKYSNEGDTVVDMFMGSGVTALESVLLNRNYVGFDINPISILISKGTLFSHFNEEKFLKDLEKIKVKMNNIAKKVYSTNNVCLNCGSNLIINYLNIGPKFKGKESGSFYCPSCKGKLKRPLKKEELQIFTKNYKIKHFIPKNSFPKKFYKDRFSYKGISKVSDMYTNRNLYILSEILNVIRSSSLNYPDLFLLAFTNTTLHASKLKSENVRPLNVNNYWIPDDYFEENAWLRFLDRVELIFESKKILEERINSKKLGKYRIYEKSSIKTNLKSDSVDYIITDPPYGETIQYSELSFIWNSWIEKKFEISEEIIINPAQNKKIDDFIFLLEKTIIEAKRILKDQKRYTLCFHNKDFIIWKKVLDLFKKYDFCLENVELVSTKGNSYNHNWAKFSPKSDLYLTFIKSKFKHTHDKKYTLKDLLKKILLSEKSNEPSKIYDNFSANLIEEMYYNKFEIDTSCLNIKYISRLIEEIKNGN
ncbi:MAG: DNA methyltransferase [Candidatus Pacearchaeota archaeon]